MPNPRRIRRSPTGPSLHLSTTFLVAALTYVGCGSSGPGGRGGQVGDPCDTSRPCRSDLLCSGGLCVTNPQVDSGPPLEDLGPGVTLTGLEVSPDDPTLDIAVGDLTGDNLADLYVANWSCTPNCGRPSEGDKDNLYHNNGDGTFTDVADLLSHQTWGAGFIAGFVDFDDDGDLDIYLVNDEFLNPVGNALWRNDGAGCDGWCFTDVSQAAGADQRVMGMGLAVGDPDNDLDFDFYFSNVGPMTLLVNQGDGKTIFYAVTVDTRSTNGSLETVALAGGSVDDHTISIEAFVSSRSSSETESRYTRSRYLLRRSAAAPASIDVARLHAEEPLADDEIALLRGRLRAALGFGD